MLVRFQGTKYLKHGSPERAEFGDWLKYELFVAASSYTVTIAKTSRVAHGLKFSQNSQ